MDQPARVPQIPPPAPPSANGKRAVDAAALPPSAARRVKLLFMLIVLPVVAVSLPAILVTMIFGQHAKPRKAQDVSGLHEALQKSADALLPTPSTLTGEPIKLTCRPERLAARAERVVKQADAFGGTANEWLASEGEKHFYVELPAGRAEAFRQSLAGDAPLAVPASPAKTAATAKDQVEVFINAKSDE